ncbi:unnamed protein product [Rotaria socialis]|nr:unnamed protein product [Rotaria socialis]
MEYVCLFLNIYSYFYIIVVVSENCKRFGISIDNYDPFSLVLILIFEMICINLLDKEKITYSIRSITYTIIYGLLVARFCDAFNLSCPLDIFTVYFLIWQIMFIITEWESNKLPLISLTFYRAWLCIMPASIIFVIHDFVFRYLPIQVNFLLLWLIAFADVIRCLHPKNSIYSTKILNELSTDGKPSLIGFYYSWNFDDNESDQSNSRACLGLADFAIFNFMLLLILPPLSSARTKVYITIGHIIAVQIGQELTNHLECMYNQWVQPGVPLPVIVVLFYAILLNTFIEY